jgi:hypothetical protein
MMAETFPNDSPQERAFREFAAMVVGSEDHSPGYGHDELKVSVIARLLACERC